MAYVEERKIKSGNQYRLVESYRQNGKVKHIRTYLGTKAPPKPWKGLTAETIERLKQKAKSGNYYYLDEPEKKD